MDLVSNAITAVVTLLAVTLGGWLTTRNQDRLWRRDHARQWRDIRLAAYTEFLAAYDEYLAYACEPAASITAVPHPWIDGEWMPFFDERGTRYKEKLEAAGTTAKFVSGRPETETAIVALVRRTRRVAAARATHPANEVPPEVFQELWAAQDVFAATARIEVDLPVMPRDVNGQ